jgi:ribonucleoside-diphosphate reductase alpha chain
MEVSSQILSDITVYSKYARYLPEKQRREVWSEIVDRNKAMHIQKFPKLKDEIENVYRFVYERKVLPSMRSLQFAGKPIQLNPARMFNCSYLPMDDVEAFGEVMFLLLSGVGVGYSVQRSHVEKLPEIIPPIKAKRYLIGDSIEGWSDAVKVLVKSYFTGKPRPDFDFSDIRPKGARLITSGGKAPGPEPLKDCLHNVGKILDRKKRGEKLTPLEVHEINCYIADAVLAGGIRRSAMIALFSLTDQDMLTCKFNHWYETKPHLGRANNSAVLLRHRVKKEDFMQLWEKIKHSGSGEPGFFMTNDKDLGTNPCGEVSLRPCQFCNLVEVNVSNVVDQQDLNERVRAAAFIATLQASYTNFHYLRDIWKETTEKEALIGVGMTGIASGKVLELDMEEAAELVKETNAVVAKKIGINKAARCTVVKPAGTTSLVLGTSSGIHAWYDKYYLRRMRVGKNEAIYSYLKNNHPELVEDDFFRPHIQAIVTVPVKAPDGAITRTESAIDLLNRVSLVYRKWIKPGHRRGSNFNNVSVTVSVKQHEWDEVGEWLWEHRDEYTAISVLPAEEYNHTYIQLPFQSITKSEYQSLLKSLTKLDLTKVVELQDDTSLQGEVSCGGNACQIA